MLLRLQAMPVEGDEDQSSSPRKGEVLHDNCIATQFERKE